MARYDDSIIEQVREANDIVDVVGQYVRLTKKGANYFGLCPFHGEKTASFSVSPRKQIYYCFGCGKGGSVYNFLMDYENMSFSEALSALAARANIALPEVREERENQAEHERKERLFTMHKEAAVHYNGILRTEEGRPGYEYLSVKRRLSDRTITHFGLGYSGKKPDGLYCFLKEKGYTDEEMKDSGLIVFEERGIHDRFWNRVMFPIMDTRSRVVAFGGRVLGDALPKYLNSPETMIFSKSQVLYGLNFARRSGKDHILLAEGYMDVVSLHQAGFTNAAASLGTALNEKHARLLKRYTGTVILAQDSDEAGTKAKLRAYPILRQEGLNVKILTTGECKDPDEMIRTRGADAYSECIAKARNAFMFSADVLKRSFDLSDPAAKTEFYNRLADMLCMFEEPLERRNYTEAVCREYMIDLSELGNLTETRYLKNSARGPAERRLYDPDRVFLQNRRQETAPAADTASPEAIGPGRETMEHRDRGQSPHRRKIDASVLKSERLLLSFLCSHKELKDTVFSYLSPEDFTEGIYRDIAGRLKEQKEISPSAIMDAYADNEEISATAGAILNADARYLDSEGLNERDYSKAVTEAVRRILRHQLDGRLQSCSDMNEFIRLTARKQQIDSITIDIT